MNPKEGEFDRFAPENISAVVGWLASDLSAGVTGQVVKVMGGQVQLLRGWRPGHRGHRRQAVDDRHDRRGRPTRCSPRTSAAFRRSCRMVTAVG